MYITELTNSVTRNVLEAVRTFTIWATVLVLHYSYSTTFGEPWTKWSYVELSGFAVLVFGLFIYYHVLRLPCFYYPTDLVMLHAKDEEAMGAGKYPIAQDTVQQPW